MTSLTEMGSKYLPYGTIKDAINRGLVSVVNASNQMAPYISAYLNFLIRNYKRSNAEESDSKIRTGLALVEYLNDKDYFFLSYERTLARRLIDTNNGLLNLLLDVEQSILSIIKNIYGNLVTARCERMFSDYHVSCSLSNEFNSSTRIDQLEIKMLMVSSNWPLSVSCMPDAPPLCFLECINTYWELFNEFYKTNHHNRRLKLLWQYSSVEIIINDPKWTHKSAPYAYRIICDLPVALVLSLFFCPQSRAITNTQSSSTPELSLNDIRSIKQRSLLAKILLRLIKNRFNRICRTTPK